MFSEERICVCKMKRLLGKEGILEAMNMRNLQINNGK
jgi:hypothetical protein